MKDPKLKTIYVCTNCGETSPRWMGKCPSCGSWNTMVEDVVAPEPKPAAAGGLSRAAGTATAHRLSEVSTTEEKSRIPTGISKWTACWAAASCWAASCCSAASPA
jgi:DNA repair protein RadA/Sms